MIEKKLKIETEINLTENDLIKLLEGEIELIIPPSNKVLIEKLKLIVKYNQYSRFHPKIKIEKFIKKQENITFEIKPTDITRLKKYLVAYHSANLHTNEYILKTDCKLIKDKKLTLEDLHTYYLKHNEAILKEDEIKSYTSIKIYDFYKNSQDKNKFFSKDGAGTSLISNIYDKVNKIEILSIIDTNIMHEFLSEVHKSYKEKVNIKHIVNTEHAYIPSIFFIIIKFKTTQSANYKEYIFYLEEELNWGVAGYVTKKTFSKQFSDLLEQRFDIQFRNPKNINFNLKDEKDDFETSIKDMISGIDKILNTSSLDFEKEIHILQNKIIILKLHYPKMDYSYKLLSRIIKYITIVKGISITSEHRYLEKTDFIIKEIVDKKINVNLNNILNDILINQMHRVGKIDILKLRKGVYVNEVSNTGLALSDMFNELEWNNKNSILTSLKTIEYSEEMLKKLFSSFGLLNDDLNYIVMQSLYKNKIIKQIIHGEEISIIK